MRTFRIGTDEDRRFVTLEVHGEWLRVIKGAADGSTKQIEREFDTEAQARSACADAAEKLTSNGYVERFARDAKVRQPGLDAAGGAGSAVRPEAPDRRRPSRGQSAEVAEALPPRPASAGRKPGRSSGKKKLDLADLADGDAVEAAEPLLPRLAPAVVEPGAKKPAPGKKKKKRKAAKGEDALDKRVVAGFVAFGVLALAVVGFLGHEAFFKPASIVGHWEGSLTEHEIGKFVRNTQYRLILDEKKNASMSIQGGEPSSGTYALQGDRLKLTLKDEEGESSEVQYKVKLDRATLDLYEPSSGKKLVQLIRFHQQSVAKKKKSAEPANVAAGPADQGADEKLASVAFAVQDGAFALKHPPGWEVDTGGRSDNSYSWAKFTKGSARIRIYADVAGSLLAGPNSGDYGEGSPMAPVHGAHERYKKTASELYGNYEESQPAPFKGSRMGEGRIATFTASGEGLFGSKIKGIRITLLTGDRRISILCDAPSKEFDALLPTFLATGRSLSR